MAANEIYTFIATKKSYATTIPLNISSLGDLVRRVRNALSATAYPTRVGELRDFPLAVAVENFLLCDGSEIAQIDFPELYAYLTDSQGTPISPANFLLPNYLASKTQAPTAPPQVIGGGSVGVGTPPPSPPTSPGGAGGTQGQPPSGGRTPRGPDEDFE